MTTTPADAENTIQVHPDDVRDLAALLKTNPNAVEPKFTGATPEERATKFLQSYSAAQRKITELSQVRQGEPPAVTPSTVNTPAAAPTTPPTGDVPPNSLEIPKGEAPAPGPSPLDAAKEEIRRTGNITPDTRVKLRAAMNVDDVVIDDYLEGQKARQKLAVEAASARVGGPEKLQAIVEWAKSSLPEAERLAINEALSNPNLVNLALDGLAERYRTANPSSREPQATPGRQVSGASASPALQPFSNQKELSDAMRHPEYRLNGKYTKEVDARIVLTHQKGYTPQ